MAETVRPGSYRRDPSDVKLDSMDDYSPHATAVVAALRSVLDSRLSEPWSV